MFPTLQALTQRLNEQGSRADRKIEDEICDRLNAVDEVDDADVDVAVADGQVVLEGSVESPRERRLVERIAYDVVGVRAVRNHLLINKAERVEMHSPH